MSASTPTPAWPLPSLLTSLARAGWGELDGRPHAGLRTVLRGLEARLPRAAAEGLVTEAQLADATGLSIRWVRRCLAALERLGLIEWHRGGIAAGRPRPSFVRVVKRRIVELIAGARPALARRLEERRKRTTERLASLPPYLRTSRHAEVTTGLLSRGGGPALTSAGLPADECQHGEPRGARYCALCRFAARRHAADSDRVPAR